MHQLSPNNRKIILVVDDVPANLALLLNHLRTLNYHVLVAESGVSALEQLNHLRPDLILLDVLMPGMDGFAVCQLIKSNSATKEIPVIFVTALNETIEKVRGLEVGGVDFITKPIDIAEVEARIRTHLLLQELRDDLAQKNLALEVMVRQQGTQIAIETKLREQISADKKQILALAQKQNAQLGNVVGSVLSNTPTQSMAWNFLHRPIISNLLNTQNQLVQLIKGLDSAENDASVLQNSLKTIHEQLQQTQQNLVKLGPLTANLPDVQLISGKLSAREQEVLIRLANGENNEEIALFLNLASATVRTYRARIMDKLNIHTIPGLVKFAILHDLVPVN